MLTEVTQYSLGVLPKPCYILYLDAKSAFDKVLLQILIRNLYFCGTSGKELLCINHRLQNRRTIAEWDRTLMGPIRDEIGVEQGGVNSGELYKIYSKPQLQMAQDSNLGVPLAPGIVISALGQADDTVLVSNDLHSLQNLLQLTLLYCSKNNVELCPGKTVLQVMSTKDMAAEIRYLKQFSPVSINDIKIQFHDNTEHVGIVRSVHGNLPNILQRISAHKKAMGAVLSNGLARHHRSNPAARLKVEQVYGTPVLLSGLASLQLKNSELAQISKHHRTTILNLLHLPPSTPQPVLYFLAGSLPCEALIHLRQLTLLGMISRQNGSYLYRHCLNVFTSKSGTGSWFRKLRDICLMYQLPHPLEILSSPLSKHTYQKQMKKKVLNYWELKLRQDSSNLSSLKHFKPQFMSLSKPHPLLITAGASPYEVCKANIQVLFLSGRYRTEQLCRHWSKNPSGFCLSPSCEGMGTIEDVHHIFLQCDSLSHVRQRLVAFTLTYSQQVPLLSDLLLSLTNPCSNLFLQFMMDCSVIPQVITLVQAYGQEVLHHLFKVSRTWCYFLHRERLRILGRWFKQ